MKFKLPLMVRALVLFGAMVPPLTLRPPLPTLTVPFPPRVDPVFTTILVA